MGFFTYLKKSSLNETVNALYMLIEIDNLPEDIKERCFLKVLKNSFHSYILLREMKNIPENKKKLLGEKASEDAFSAFMLVTNIDNVSSHIKEKAIQVICNSSPHYSYELLRFGRYPIHMERKLQETVCRNKKLAISLLEVFPNLPQYIKEIAEKKIRNGYIDYQIIEEYGFPKEINDICHEPIMEDINNPYLQ